MTSSQPLDAAIYAAQPRHAPVKPVEGKCGLHGCFPDVMGPDPTVCLYCGEVVEP